ncbi:hypothetical protein K1T71_005412 [Dendrolimus kikuchii]|uniref:Uncharacterized protein n=1 Tax=Dendrolimus kikuchii TaxID=765133 RepID=A0ACC1D456_9NEOP|nr:hypothetical protein K1T71_005412 [Dendrolimus kikuchii]
MKMYQFILLLAISFASAEHFEAEEECLNYTVYPVQYEITLMPYLAKESSYYHCDLKITVIAHASVQVIEMDAKDLKIQGDSIKVLDVCKHPNTADCSRDIVNPARPFEYDAVKGKLYIYLSEPLKVYNSNNEQFYYIMMTFYRHVNEESTGLFLSKYYDDADKVWKYMFTSRLSPNKAKYVFPCFDNPKFESSFKFRVYLPPADGEVQMTNTSLVICKELRRQYAKDNMTVIEYMPSPQMPLYQLGIHQSQYASSQAKAKSTNDTIFVWAPAHELVYYDYILFFGRDMIDLLHEYSTIHRAIVNGPINIVAVPSNRVNGYEIGSWSLLTNGVQKIVNIDELTSIKQIERMNFELAQQLSRIWLGNPGEEEWTRWKEEWFKEGMATYFAYYLLAQYNYGRHTTEPRAPLGIYGLQMKHKAMAVDWHRNTPALELFNSSLAIEIPARHKQLVTMKTGALLWMLENWIGSEKFHQALVKYINSRRGKYISLQDFMTALDKETVECSYQFFNGSTSSRILKSWFRQQGYPVINVQVLRDRIPNAVQLKQRQFSFTPDNREESEYLIPISYLVQDSANCYNCYQPRFTIGRQTYTFGENLNNGWIILNRNASGYYRVNYDDTTWKLIAKTLRENHRSIDEMNRAQIANDVLALYVAGDLDQRLAMEVLGYLDQEESAVVWDSVISGFELMKIEGAACNMTHHIYWEWEDFLAQKVSKIFESLTKNKEQQQKIRFYRSNIIQFACEVNYKPCLKYLHQLYEEHRANKIRLEPDSRETCYYMLSNDSYSAFNYEKLNAIEQADKEIAEHRVREKNRFFIKISVGEPSPAEFVMPTQSTLIPVTEKLTPANESSVMKISTFISICFILLISCNI